MLMIFIAFSIYIALMVIILVLPKFYELLQS